MKNLRVIDFFCGAGGFSEGFRQEGFKIIMGVDNWLPGIKTHNLNHNLDDTPRDILDFEDIENIESLPDSEIIVGSPPCVSFSHSNRGGNADKSVGIRLINAYLRVVAVKKHKPGSVLKAWLMENVPNSRNYVKEFYTFEDLNLADWASLNGLDSKSIALNVKNNGDILKASDYGSAQARNRFVCGEVTETGKFPFPKKVSSTRSLHQVREALPHPLGEMKKNIITDPNYPGLKLDANDLTDHFYDTGVYEIEWRRAQNAKQNHPYMGKMSFPEDENRPSRTIMATRSASTREAILYRSELNRKGNGEYRLPTIREASSIMGFPLTYVFYGTETVKWRQIGNAVCPHLSSSLAHAIKEALGAETISSNTFQLFENRSGVVFLDDHKERNFSNPPKRNPQALFRAHPIKSGNMTVALTNRLPVGNKVSWGAVAFSGTGKNYKFLTLGQKHFDDAKKILASESPELLNILQNDSSLRYLSPSKLDVANASHHYNDETGEHPLSIVNRISDHIQSSISEDYAIDTTSTSLEPIKNQVPLSQLVSIFALGKLFQKDSA